MALVFAHGFEYIRHGTTTLFRLGDHDRHVQTAHKSADAGGIFEFMNEVVAAHPSQELHVILDKLVDSQTEARRWLRQHPRVHLHFHAHPMQS